MPTAIERARAFISSANYRVKRYGLGQTLMSYQEGKLLPLGPCFYCGDPEALSWDHRVPLVRGGANDLTNIVRCCVACNQRKGFRDESVLAQPMYAAVECSWCGQEVIRHVKYIRHAQLRGSTEWACSREHRNLLQRRRMARWRTA